MIQSNGDGSFYDDGMSYFDPTQKTGGAADQAFQQSYKTGVFGAPGYAPLSSGASAREIGTGIYDQYKQPDGSYKTPGGANLKDTGFESLMNMATMAMIGGAAGGMGAGFAGIGGASNAGLGGAFNFGDPSTWGNFASSGADAPWGATNTSVGNGADMADWWAQDSSAITPAQASEAGLNMPANNIYGGGVVAPNFGSTQVPSTPGYQPGQTQDYWNSPAGKAGATGAQSALSKLLSGSGSSSDLMNLLGAVAPGLASMAGSTSLASQLSANTAQARADRQPSLDYYNKLLAGGPEGFAAGEGSSALKGVLGGLSAKFGNPIGSGTALQLATDAAGAGWGNRVTQAAGPAGLVSGTGLLNAQNAADTTGAGMYTGLSSALSGALASQDDLAALLKKVQAAGINLGGSNIAGVLA